MRSTLALLALVVCALTPLRAQEHENDRSTFDTTQRYIVLDTIRWKTLQKELDQASAAGYRVVFGDTGKRILILEKTTEKFQYRTVGDLDKKFKAAMADSFAINPSTFSSDVSEAGSIVMEKPLNGGSVHDYLVLDTIWTRSLQKDLNERAGRGYELASLSTYGRKYAVMEKKPDTPASADRYLLLATTRSSTLQDEINNATAKGYAVVAGSGGDEWLVIMEKSASPHEYKLLTVAHSGTLEKEINETAAQGFRPLPRTLVGVTKENKMFSFSLTPRETGIVMEKISAPEPFTYKIIGTRRVGTFTKELNEAAADGYDLIGFTLTYDEEVALLRRATTVAGTTEKK